MANDDFNTLKRRKPVHPKRMVPFKPISVAEDVAQVKKDIKRDLYTKLGNIDMVDKVFAGMDIQPQNNLLLKVRIRGSKQYEFSIDINSGHRQVFLPLVYKTLSASFEKTIILYNNPGLITDSDRVYAASLMARLVNDYSPNKWHTFCQLPMKYTYTISDDFPFVFKLTIQVKGRNGKVAGLDLVFDETDQYEDYRMSYG